MVSLLVYTNTWLYRDMYYNTPFPHNVLSIVKVACSIGEKLSRVFISLSDTLCRVIVIFISLLHFCARASHSSQCRAKPFVALESQAIRRI